MSNYSSFNDSLTEQNLFLKAGRHRFQHSYQSKTNLTILELKLRILSLLDKVSILDSNIESSYYQHNLVELFLLELDAIWRQQPWLTLSFLAESLEDARREAAILRCDSTCCDAVRTFDMVSCCATSFLEGAFLDRARQGDNSNCRCLSMAHAWPKARSSLLSLGLWAPTHCQGKGPRARGCAWLHMHQPYMRKMAHPRKLTAYRRCTLVSTRKTHLCCCRSPTTP